MYANETIEALGGQKQNEYFECGKNQIGFINCCCDWRRQRIHKSEKAAKENLEFFCFTHRNRKI
jgi:hypothetical protein